VPITGRRFIVCVGRQIFAGRFVRPICRPTNRGQCEHRIRRMCALCLRRRSKSATLNIVVNRTVPLGPPMTSSSREAVGSLLRTPGLVLIFICLVSTGCVLCVVTVTSCVVCRRRSDRHRQCANRRNSRTEASGGRTECARSRLSGTGKEGLRDSRTEALKALTSQSDNGGVVAAACRPEVLTTANATSFPAAARTSTSSLANGSASASAGYQPVACLSPHTSKVSFMHAPVRSG